ncbi:MAG TPA: PF20097 family protein [Thermoplasmata archaeon]|nr:PF20097 family protein [Thermoplasmata archaeon]
MAAAKCPACGSDAEAGFIATSNGSGLFWSHSSEPTRVRPHDLEVLVPTGFMGTYSANLPAVLCRSCGTISAKTKATPKGG